MDKLDLILEVLENFNSTCTKCKGTGVIIVNANKNICDCCDGKGYHSGKEIIDATKALGKNQRQEEQKKHKRKAGIREDEAAT